MGPLGVRMGPGVAKKCQKCTQKGLHWEKIEKDLKIRQQSAVFSKKSQIRGLETLVMGEHRKNEPILQIIPNSVNLASKKWN